MGRSTTLTRFVLLAAAITQVSHAGDAVTHAAVWMMKRPGAPAPGPDGKWVVFPLTEPAYDAKDAVSDLWVVPGEGGAPARRLTSAKGAESDPAWSPDGRLIAFAAKREGDEETQIYILDFAAGGEARRLTSLSTGASNPKFSPDGKLVLFQSDVYPGAADDEANRKAAADRKARKYNARAYDSFPIRHWDRWLDDRRPHVFVQPLDGSAVARDLLAGTALAAGAGFAGVSANSGEELHAVWTPDGGSVAFVATRTQNASAYSPVPHWLYEVKLSGGEPRIVAGGSPNAGYTAPQFSADGRTLFALRETRADGKAYHLDRIVRMPWPNGEPALVAPGFDRSVERFVVSSDGRTLHALAEEQGTVKVFSMPAAGGDARPTFDKQQGVYSGLAVSAKAGTLVATWNSAVSPPEVVRLNGPGASGAGHAPLTSFNRAAAARLDWQPVEHFWFTSKKGRRIHNVLVRPPAFDAAKKYPLIAFIHGGPHNMSRDEFHTRWNYHLLAAPGYAVLATNYTGSTGFGEQFSQAIQGDPLRTPGEEINEAVDEALRRYPFLDAARLAAGGASYGGHLSNWLQASTERFRCLFSHAGLVNLESQWGTSDSIYHRELANGGPPWEQGPVWREQNPIRYAPQFRTPVLVTVGERDYRVPMNNVLEYWSVLQRQRVPSRLLVFPDENHWVLKGENNRYFFEELHAWLARWLK